MAGQSVDSLLAWMKDNSRLFGWDAVMALASDKVNELLQHTYLINLSQGVVQKVPAGDITMPQDPEISHYFSDFILGPPLLSLDRTSFASSSVAVGLAVVSGVHTLLKTSLGQSQIRRLAVYGPLNGPQLHLDLQLTTSPPAVTVDLAQGENVLLRFPGTAAEQRETGKFFQAWLGNPANQGQVYPLGSFAAQGNPLLRVRRIDIGSQLEEAAGSLQQPEKRAALLFFLTMEHGVTGAFPGNDADFRYLIPDDADQAYSATALFSLPVLHRAAFGYAVLQLLDAAEFEFIDTPAEPLRKMVALAGSFQVTAARWQSADYLFESEAFEISASAGEQPLTVEFAPDQATQTWQFPCSVAFRYRPVKGTAWTSHTGTFKVSLKHEFHLSADESGAGAMEGQLFVPYAFNHEVEPVFALPGNPAPTELEQIKGFIAYTIKSALLEGFSQTLTTAETDTFLTQWSLTGDNALQPVVSALPYDLAVFGRMDSGSSSLRIDPQHAVLAAGDRLQLTARPGVRWSLENPPGSGGNSGTIDEQEGLYRAPPAHTMTEAVHRVVVIATDLTTNERSSALITVQVSRVSINPLLQVANYDERVPFSAGGLGEDALEWSIKSPVADESGTLAPDDDPDGDHVYLAGPKVTGKTYVLDEIEVRDSQGVDAASAWVLVCQQPPALVVKPVEDGTLPEGHIRLAALFNDIVMEVVHWRLPIGGPGAIDEESGIYSSSPGAPEHFVLVFAEVDGGDFGRFEGHLVLPLPLNHFPTVLQALAGE